MGSLKWALTLNGAVNLLLPYPLPYLFCPYLITPHLRLPFILSHIDFLWLCVCMYVCAYVCALPQGACSLIEFFSHRSVWQVPCWPLVCAQNKCSPGWEAVTSTYTREQFLRPARGKHNYLRPSSESVAPLQFDCFNPHPTPSSMQTHKALAYCVLKDLQQINTL